MSKVKFKNHPEVKKAIQSSIREDVGNGDITTSLLVSNKLVGVAEILVKEKCIIAGIEVAKLVSKSVDKKIQFKFYCKDGDSVNSSTVIGKLKGPVSSILKAERVMLNFMQRMSGIATKTSDYAKLIQKEKAKILDTRKTTPNFRIFEKWAVSIGGGTNHRFGLYDEILVKDNHIEANKNIKLTLDKLKKTIKTNSRKYKIVVEVKNKPEFLVASAYEIVDRILLDNMKPSLIKDLVKINNGRKMLEVSGGIDKKNVLKYAQSGVDCISIGALTHHIDSIDISLNVVK
jgi:nicotinate-nucleotide pyrophosphorylase (carboxylating)